MVITAERIFIYQIRLLGEGASHDSIEILMVSPSQSVDAWTDLLGEVQPYFGLEQGILDIFLPIVVLIEHPVEVLVMLLHVQKILVVLVGLLLHALVATGEFSVLFEELLRRVYHFDFNRTSFLLSEDFLLAWEDTREDFTMIDIIVSRPLNHEGSLVLSKLDSLVVRAI